MPATTLHENVDGRSILTHLTPAILSWPLNGDEFLVDEPGVIPVALWGLTHLSLGRSNILAPRVNGIVGARFVTAGKPFFDLSGIAAEPMVKPDDVIKD